MKLIKTKYNVLFSLALLIGTNNAVSENVVSSSEQNAEIDSDALQIEAGGGGNNGLDRSIIESLTTREYPLEGMIVTKRGEASQAKAMDIYFNHLLALSKDSVEKIRDNFYPEFKMKESEIDNLLFIMARNIENRKNIGISKKRENCNKFFRLTNNGRNQEALDLAVSHSRLDLVDENKRYSQVMENIGTSLGRELKSLVENRIEETKQGLSFMTFDKEYFNDFHGIDPVTSFENSCTRLNLNIGEEE